jgi:beta-glucosidase
MSKYRIFLFILFFLSVLLIGCNSEFYLDEFGPRIPATQGVPRQWGWWIARHEVICVLAEGGNLEAVFIGDSITQGWDDHADIWHMIHTRYRSGNFGFGSDTTRQVIWRLENGEFPPALRPKFVILLIGSNNTGLYRDSPQMTGDGIYKIIEIIHANSPETKIVLLSILPRGDNKYYDDTNKAVNQIIKNYHGKLNVTYYDVYDDFLLPDGQINKSLFQSDLGHLSAYGYLLLAGKLLDLLPRLEAGS